MIAPASRKIGKYEIIRKLGRGGMADVYLAQDTTLGHTVALKAIEHAPDSDSQDAIEAERRGAELQAHLAALDPHVVRVYDFGDADGYFYLAMEYVDGQDVAELMRRGPLPAEFAADVAIAVARTLEIAHSMQVAIGGRDFQGVVHGDIKPKNIRIDSRGEVRVLDFGIAKALSMSRRLTRNEFGSVPYSSPERLDSGEVSVDADLWALAVMLYEMVAGSQPFVADTTGKLERRIRSRVSPAPPEECPEPLRRILIKALAPDPAVRYATAQEFGEDLAAFRAGLPARAESEDLDATRRTPRPSDNGGETRRTAPAADDETVRTVPHRPQSVRRENWPPRSARPASPVLRNFGRAALVVCLIVFVWLSWVLISGMRLYGRGKQLNRAIAAEQVTEPNEIWKRWTELSQGHSSSLLLHGVRNAVRDKMIAAADKVITAYRNGDAVVYENTWKGARDFLSRALVLDPDDSVRGKLRLAEGHLARINGSSRVAVEKFTEAQQLLPKSPDPHLGLARVYVVALKDIDRAYEALRQAERQGFRLGNREQAQLADGYRERADRLFWDSRNVRGLPQEKEQIERAREDYERALELYESIVPFANASASIVRVQSSLESVDFRLREIAGQPVDR